MPSPPPQPAVSATPQSEAVARESEINEITHAMITPITPKFRQDP